MTGRHLLTAAATLTTLFGLASSEATEITLRMRGGTFEVKGELESSNTKAYVVTVPGVGRLTLDAERYECIDGCPEAQTEASVLTLSATAAPPTTTWTGGSAVGTEFMPRFVRAYAAAIGATTTMSVGADPRNLIMSIKGKDGRPLGQVNINRQGVTPGFLAMAKKEGDAVWTGRRVLPEEEQMMSGAGIASMKAAGNEHVWALDGLIVVVPKTSPVAALSLLDIAKVFAGEITDWSELGYPAGKINVYAPTSEAGAYSLFESQVLAAHGRKIASSATRLLHATEWSDKVADDPNGIGLTILAMVRRAKALNITSPCGIIVPPTLFNVKTEEYPLTRRLYFYTPGAPENPLAKALLAFAMSTRLQPVLKDAGFVDQEPEILPFQAHSARMATAVNTAQEKGEAALLRRLLQDLQGMRRVSFTFRFASGTSALDNRALEDVRRLRTMLAQPDMKGRQLILAGFSDSVGSFTKNVTLSELRLRTVRDALIANLRAAGTPLLERAYGPLAPVACNDSEDGRALNRRVEVWIP